MLTCMHSLLTREIEDMKILDQIGGAVKRKHRLNLSYSIKPLPVLA